MNGPELHLPSSQSDTRDELPVQINRIPEWLDSLPVTNTQKSANQLVTLLNRLNRYPLPVAERAAALSQCKAVAETLIAGLNKSLTRVAYPLPKKAKQPADTVYQLLNEFAIGYKILVMELSKARLMPGKKQRLGDAVLAAHQYLSRFIVHCYSLYMAIPEGTWQDIHTLFSFARDECFRNRENPREDIAHEYKRICLLALCNPYQLMQGEAENVFNKLDRWAASVTLTKLAGNRPPEGVYYTDLASDIPPRYALDSSNPETTEAYAFAVDGLLRNISQRIKELIDTHASEQSRAVRRERDLLLRLERAWTTRRRRRFPRTQHLSEVVLTGSLSACHYYVSGESPFDPEARELAIQQQMHKELELIPEDYKPWKLQGGRNRASEAGSGKHESLFQGHDLNADIWKKIYVTEYRDPEEKPLDPAFPAAPLFQLDESVGGLCVRCGADSPLRVQVGELVAYEAGEPRNPDNWRIGAVRWLIQSANQDLEIGIKRLARNAEAIAARAVQGVGKNSGFFRALLIPRADPRDKATALIVPSGVYDVGTVIALELGEEILYAQLTKMLETTGCYAVFAFRIVETPGESLLRTAGGPEREVP